ncbi:MAG: hypothetical protein EZS28_030839, partial [Streblomastix strix]
SGEVKYSESVAYCPQTAWILNNTVRGNIIFGNEYDQEKYNEVVHVCALEPDFNTLAAGDMTAIGEKGVNLSGGQKARIQLARAVYSDRDIYILDDPLSAVDAHVGRLSFLEKADNIILLNEGRIKTQGTYTDLKQQGIDFEQYIIKDHKEENYKQNNILTEEEFETGSVPWSQYIQFFFTLLPASLRVIYLLIYVMIEVVQVALNWWLIVIGSETTYPKITYHFKMQQLVVISIQS